MAEEKRQVNVDFTKYPDLYQALEELVVDLDTDRSKLIRQLVRERIDLHEHIERKIGARVRSQIKRTAKS